MSLAAMPVTRSVTAYLIGSGRAGRRRRQSPAVQVELQHRHILRQAVGDVRQDQAPRNLFQQAGGQLGLAGHLLLLFLHVVHFLNLPGRLGIAFLGDGMPALVLADQPLGQAECRPDGAHHDGRQDRADHVRSPLCFAVQIIFRKKAHLVRRAHHDSLFQRRKPAR
jgi:hypothetical protein